MTPQRQLDHIWTNKFTSVMYPMTQIPPDKYKLPNFAWFEDIRPKDKNDIFVWRGKGKDKELKAVKRHSAPLQVLTKKAQEQETPNPPETSDGAKQPSDTGNVPKH